MMPWGGRRMEEVVITAAVRTAIGRLGGSLKDVPPQDLGARVVAEVLNRADIVPDDVDEVILGQTRQTTEASNIARVAALKAGIPEEVPAFTVHRQCASALQAVISGVREIQVGARKTVVAGGTEVLSRAPYYLKEARYGYRMGNATLVDSLTEAGIGAQPLEIYGELPMGMTAEIVAERYSISREEQDAFALESQKRAARAIEAGLFKDEILPLEVPEGRQTRIFDVDEHPRKDTTLEKLAKLPPAFKKGGTVTAGNTCGFNDGAAAVVLMSLREACRRGIKPLAVVRADAVVGVSPRVMGIGPVPAVRQVFEKTGLTATDMDVIELNEAFAAQVLAAIRELDLDPVRVNPNGGAIALGHPIGATGAVILAKLLYQLVRTEARFGLATLCIGGGQGMALLVERAT